MFDINALLRKHLIDMKPYSSARDEYTGAQGVFLDANENPFGSITDEDWNRYPDPYQSELKKKIGAIKGVDAERIFLGNGSDEPIDLLFRAFCEPGVDNVIINPPTYGMYQVSADINAVETRKVLLTNDYDLNVEAILEATDENTKMVFICSPNNPSGSDLSAGKIEEVIRSTNALVVVDEAYIDFSSQDSWVNRLPDFSNLVVLQTFSKAWGLASLRLGMAFASEAILQVLNKIKPPYNISGLTQKTVFDALENQDKKEQMVSDILENKEELEEDLNALPFVKKVWPSAANFFLVTVENGAKSIYRKLIEQRVIIRDRSGVVLCQEGLRITVGTKEENQKLIGALKNLELK